MIAGVADPSLEPEEIDVRITHSLIQEPYSMTGLEVDLV